MAYNRTTWTDRVVSRQRTFNLVNNSDGTTTLNAAEGTVTAQGTAFTASIMNKIEQGIYDNDVALENHQKDHILHTPYYNATHTTVSGASVYSVTIPNVTSWIPGMSFAFYVPTPNVGTTTQMRINGASGVYLTTQDGKVVRPGGMKAGTIVTVRFYTISGSIGGLMLQGTSPLDDSGWITATPTSPFANYGSTPSLRYRKWNNEVCIYFDLAISGSIVNTGNYTIFTLPTDYRPATYSVGHVAVVYTSAYFMPVIINNINGNVMLAANAAATSGYTLQGQIFLATN